jgi:hypothetical protein
LPGCGRGTLHACLPSPTTRRRRNCSFTGLSSCAPSPLHDSSPPVWPSRLWTDARKMLFLPALFVARPCAPLRSHVACLEDSELLALSLPGTPSAELSPADVILACCRGLQHVDVPTANCGLERLFRFTTYACRASLTSRRGSSGGNGCEADCAAHIENFVQEGTASLVQSLYPLMRCPAFSIGESTLVPATPTRGAIATMVVAVRVGENFRHPSGFAKGEQAQTSLYAASSTDEEGSELVRFTLQQERRPPLQNCWLITEILPARLHDMENKYTWI